jgi:hypothetical protein
MVYVINISYDTELDHWVAVGENSNLAMMARSIDLLIEQSNLGLSDLVGKNDLEVEYRLTHRMNVRYG